MNETRVSSTVVSLFSCSLFYTVLASAFICDLGCTVLRQFCTRIAIGSSDACGMGTGGGHSAALAVGLAVAGGAVYSTPLGRGTRLKPHSRCASLSGRRAAGSLSRAPTLSTRRYCWYHFASHIRPAHMHFSTRRPRLRRRCLPPGSRPPAACRG